MKLFLYLRVGIVCVFVLVGVQLINLAGNKLIYINAPTGKPVPTPEQVHVTYLSPTEAVVAWVTSVEPDMCEFVTESSQQQFFRRTNELWDSHMFQAKFTTEFDKEVTYNITCFLDDYVASRSFTFQTHPGFGDNVTMLILADWATAEIGNDGDPKHTTIPKPNVLDPLLAEDIPYWSVWHIGDFAYDLHTFSGLRGSQFMNSIEEIASSQPYMAIPGNHELSHLFYDFRHRFANPLFYRLDVGKAAIFALNAEFDYYLYKTYRVPMKQVFYHYLMEQQMTWLELEFQNVDRETTPWVIVMMHKTFYSSSKYKSVNSTQEPTVREKFETLLVDNQVDLVISGHIHIYERILPIKYGSLVPGVSQKQHVFTDLSAPVYIINGVAGNIESKRRPANETLVPAEFSASLSESLGYGFLTIVNCSHLRYEQYAFGETQWDDISVDLVSSKRLIDHVTLIKSNAS